MIIALSGMSGTGKSTIKNLLAKELGLKSYSMGDLRGKMALAKGMTIDEFNALSMNDITSDREVDELQKKLGETEDNFIVDGWLSWYFIPNAFKVQLTVDPVIAAERIYKARIGEKDRDDEPMYSSPEETARILDQRMKDNEARYQKWYGISLKNDEKCDISIETTHRSPEEIIALILASLPKNS